MKSICITGASRPDLQCVAGILQHAGMKSAKPAKRDDPIDIAYWHEQVLALAAEESDDKQILASPSRLWEQLASDIFIANIKSKLWGWADLHSASLLDFWLNFEPRLYFILVCTSPVQMLASVIESSADTDPVDAVLDGWQSQHQQMLRFHHRNPKRCLLVDAGDCAAHPEALIARCNTQWKLGLDDAKASTTDDTGPGALATYLAQQLCRSYPQATSLQQELAATIYRLGQPRQTEKPTMSPFDDIMADYRILRDRSIEAEQLDDAQQNIASLTNTINDLNAEKSAQKAEKSALAARHYALQGEVAALTQAHDAHQAQFATERQAQADALKVTDAKLKESQQENELLLLQLHQVQEELEHYFLQHQDVQKQLDAAQDRWQRMLQRTPNFCDYELLEILPPEQDDGDAIRWRIKHLNAAGRCLPELTFKTIIESGIAGFILSRTPGTPGPLLRWPAVTEQPDQHTLIPIGNRNNLPQRIESLLDLATSDWHLLHTLSTQLSKALESPATLNAPAKLQPAALRAGLGKLTQVIEKFPVTLRYDTLSLKREQVNPDYEHLWFSFGNLAFGGKQWPHFEFRLSCANVRPGRFGLHPKLEFPEETSQAPFDSWFVEAYDDFGAKLELRFALPESMDIAVWQRLSENDRSFVTALIKRLPAILGNLQQAGTALRRPWDDWRTMAAEMQRILTVRTAPPPAEIAQAAQPATPPPVAKAPAAPRPATHRPAAPVIRKKAGSSKKPRVAASKTVKPAPVKTPRATQATQATKANAK